MNKKQPGKRHQPSFKDGKLRDKRIAEKMNPRYANAHARPTSLASI